jgi:dolichol-phosphate mannosyltransferase
MDIQQLYRRRFPEAGHDERRAIWAVIVREFLQQWIPPEGVVLDVGCGYGEFLNHVRARRRIGIDLNEDSRAHLHPSVEFHFGDIRDLGFLPDASIDLVFTSNVLEHLPGKADVEQVLSEGLRVLKPGGRFIAVGPNMRFLPGEYWDFWDHLTPISDRSLLEVLKSIGYSIERSIPRFLPYTTRSALPQRPWMVGLYLRHPMVWRILGRQFFISALK